MDDMSLKISASPHVRSKDTTSDIMFDVIIALVPATAFGIYQFGVRAAILVAACVLSAVLFEFLYQYFMKKKVTVLDFSAVVTGLLLALNLPPTLPVWMGVLGSGFAIIIVKQLFGGLGQNFMNPALAARCFLLLSFTRHMTTFVYDGATYATPLALHKMGLPVEIKDMFFGYTAGTIGETSTLALLIGAAYLLIKRVISPKIPVFYIGSFAICIALYGWSQDVLSVTDYTLAHLCGGGLMLGAWFMATDYVTSPITSKGKIIYGIMLGLLTFVLRIFGSSAEGVSYAIIISNLFVPIIEKITAPKSFGHGADIKKEKKNKKEKESDSEDKTSEDKEERKADKSDDVQEKEKMDIKGIVTAIVAILVITLVMGAALGAVYNVTKEPIDKAKEEAKLEAYEAVYPGAGSIVTLTQDQLDYDAVDQLIEIFGYNTETIDELSLVMDASGTHIGYIVLVTSSEGYGGDIQMAVGVSNDLIVKGVSFLTINETVGLGMEATDEEFLSQFVGKQVDKFTYTKSGAQKDSQIDAISGATITTSAVVEGVNAAIQLIMALGGN